MVLRGEQCKTCDLRNGCDTPFMDGYGPHDAIIVICGEGPGSMEDEIGRPFIGPAGQLLQKEWDDIVEETPFNHCFLTNVVRCRPPKNRAPKTLEIKKCFPFVEEELKSLPIYLIVPTGAVAMKAFGIKGKITENSGKLYVRDGIYVMPIVHPSYILQAKRQMPLFRRGLNAIQRFLVDGHVMDLGNYDILQAGTSEEVIKRFLNKLKDAENITFDIETNGLDEWAEDVRIKCISFSTEDHHAFTIQTEEWPDEVWQWILSEIRGIMENPEIKKSGHSLSFEMKWLKHLWNTDINGIGWDTSVGAFELDKLRSNGLKEWAYDVKMGGYENILDKPVQDMEGEKLFKYCSMDSDASYRLIEYERGRMSKKQKIYMRHLAMPLTKEFHKMHEYGLLVDQEKLQRLEGLADELISLLRQRLLSNKWVRKATKTGTFAEFNPNSSRHIAHLLFTTLGAEIRKKTETGLPSTDSEVLDSLSEQFPNVVIPLIDYRTTQKFASTYIIKMRRHIRSDGRIHATWTQTVARTGRSACENPNMQNWPHDPKNMERFPEKYHPMFRPRGIIIPDPGFSFWEGDYSQQELRVAAAVSLDKVMSKIFIDDTMDIHEHTARAIFPDIPLNEKPTDQQRRAAKTVNFGILYGISAFELAHRLGFKERACEEMISSFFRKYYGYADWVEETKAFLDRHGYVVTPVGRVRNFPSLEDLDFKDREAVYREAVNTPIQGPAYDLLGMALVRFNRRVRQEGFKTRVVNTIHDSNIFHMKEGEESEITQLYKEIAVDPPEWLGGFLGNIPLKVDWKCGPNWADLSEV